MALKLWGGSDGFRTQKILVAGLIAGLEIEVPPFKAGETNKTEEYKKRNPLGKFPALDTPQGPIFESNSILRYVARLRPESGLYGSGPHQNSLVDQWLDFTANELEPVRSIWLYPVAGYLQFNAKAYQENKAAAASLLAVLNSHLIDHTFLVGNQITIADLSLAAALVGLYRDVFDPEFIKPFSSLTRWFNTIVNQPEFQKVFGKFEFAKSEKLAAGAEKGGKADKGKDKGEKKEKENNKGEKKEKEKEKPKKEEKSLADELEEEDAKPKAPKSPLDLLPASPMVLDTVKRAMFFQRPIVATFFDDNSDFWTGKNEEHKDALKFDNAGWSFWLAKYKFNDENKVGYMTSNLVGGFIQRSDAVRKYGFGVMNILGKEEEEQPEKQIPFKVQGIWCFRGLEVAPQMKDENPDSEYYEWVKLDVSKDADRKLIKENFVADVVAGEPVWERKYFK